MKKENNPLLNVPHYLSCRKCGYKKKIKEPPTIKEAEEFLKSHKCKT